MAKIVRLRRRWPLDYTTMTSFKDSHAPITVHKLTVSRTARYATTGAEAAQAKTLWVAFHGYGQLAADFITPFARVGRSDVRVIAPEGLSRFYVESPRADGGHLARTGATWLTRDDREDELRDALAMLHAVVDQEVAAIVSSTGKTPILKVLGFSQGVAMSMRWVADTAARDSGPLRLSLAKHLLWAGGLAHDVSDDAMRSAWNGTDVHVVVGEKDKFATHAFRMSVGERLTKIGVATEAHSFAGGHRLDDELLGKLS